MGDFFLQYISVSQREIIVFGEFRVRGKTTEVELDLCVFTFDSELSVELFFFLKLVVTQGSDGETFGRDLAYDNQNGLSACVCS
jgi:hypothetical protein